MCSTGILQPPGIHQDAGPHRASAQLERSNCRRNATNFRAHSRLSGILKLGRLLLFLLKLRCHTNELLFRRFMIAFASSLSWLTPVQVPAHPREVASASATNEEIMRCRHSPCSPQTAGVAIVAITLLIVRVLVPSAPTFQDIPDCSIRISSE
jgi:hypothetical protein